MPRLDKQRENALRRLATSLVDQDAARVAVPPQANSSGYWFGGGNLVANPEGGYCLVGRYRNQGDSRTGLRAGQRGLELALFESSTPRGPFTKTLSFQKRDLNIGRHEVLSIEGCALRFGHDTVELFVSTEKSGIGYPPPYESHLKPGTGVWTIDRLAAHKLDDLASQRPVTILRSRDPRFAHVKDPLLYEPSPGELVLLFCTHPYCWSSSNTAFAVRPPDEVNFREPRFNFFQRGFAWDVAMTRVTSVVDIPAVGLFQDMRVSLVFYDGGECVRNLQDHEAAVPRPRGYSCEELGGAAYFIDGDLETIHRLSQVEPLFVSPFGTGCSRYVDVFHNSQEWVATWQQAQQDGSQPLVINGLKHEEVERILSG